MEGHFLLFDSTCPHCTRVARRLRQLEIDNLGIRSLSDPAVIDVFACNGRDLPRKPALVHVQGGALEVWTGLVMRYRLAKMIGARRAAEIVTLLTAETKARIARQADQAHRTSRRRLLGGAAAGAGALVLGAGLPASAQTPTERSVPLSPGERRAVLASPALQRASQIWGEPDDSSIYTAVDKRGEAIAVVPHLGGNAAMTVVGTDGGALGVTITPNESNDGIRYFLPSGLPLAELTVRDDELVTSQLGADAAPPGADPEPLGAREFIGCFVGCMAGSISAECAIACGTCLYGSIWSKPAACATCGFCAGPAGLECARFCANFW